MTKKITQEQAEQAVRTLIEWAGDDPAREGVLDTPERVVRSYRELFAGYSLTPEEVLNATFDEVENYSEIVILRDIAFTSCCEHHMLPIIGTATVAYYPSNRVVGLSKLARIVDLYAKRLQLQEKMTAQIAEAIDQVLKPRGVAVIVNANHQCMTIRGVGKPGATCQTSHFTGCFRNDQATRAELFSLI